MRVSFIIYADFESFTPQLSTCQPNPDARDEKPKIVFGAKWQLLKILFGSQKVNAYFWQILLWKILFSSWQNYH